MKKNWLDTAMEKRGYKGCNNCKHQPKPLQTCEWLKNENIVHIICPRWEIKEQEE